MQTRIVDRDTGDYPKDALHLFAGNLFVNKYNDKILSQMPGEKFVMPCHDNVVSANIPAKECQKLIKSLPDDCQKTGNLMKSLTVVVGMIVIMTANCSPPRHPIPASKLFTLTCIILPYVL